jgi:hypothetical protein
MSKTTSFTKPEGVRPWLRYRRRASFHAPTTGEKAPASLPSIQLLYSLAGIRLFLDGCSWFSASSIPLYSGFSPLVYYSLILISNTTNRQLGALLLPLFKENCRQQLKLTRGGYRHIHSCSYSNPNNCCPLRTIPNSTLLNRKFILY